MEINKHSFSNGLRLIHSFTDITQNVTINILYGAGSRNEKSGKTGIAHLLEHLMFCGSQNIPNFDQPLEAIGGTSNAFTNNDITNYYLTLPKKAAELGFWLESDRMLNPTLSQNSFDTQKKIVLEEFKQNLNEPYGDAHSLLRKLCYKQHPYKWSTIGQSLDEVENLELEDLLSFYKRNYVPANAVISITGNISYEDALSLTEKWFAGIPYSVYVEDSILDEPEQTSTRFETYYRNIPQNAIYKAYHICNVKNKDIFKYDLLSDILANGKSSRLINNLVYEKKLFTSIDASIENSFDTGLLRIVGKIQDNVSTEEADTAINEETEKLRSQIVSDYEMEKWKNKYESIQLAERFNIEHLAEMLAYYEYIGQTERFLNNIDFYNSVSASDILTISNNLFDSKHSNTIWYLKN